MVWFVVIYICTSFGQVGMKRRMWRRWIFILKVSWTWHRGVW